MVEEYDMPEFMMIMKGPDNNGDWQDYIKRLHGSGMFRGGSVLGRGQCLNKSRSRGKCTVTGFMRFEADDISEVVNLVAGNPDYESGSDIEVLEVIVS